MSTKAPKLRASDLALPTQGELESAGVECEETGGNRVVRIPKTYFWDLLGGIENATLLDHDALIEHIAAIYGQQTEANFNIEDKGDFVLLVQSREDVKDEELDLDVLADQLQLKTKMGKAALGVALENIQMLDQKNVEYGPGNITKFGLRGVVIRASDKIERLATLTGGSVAETEIKFESLENNLADLSNYGVIGLLCKRGIWK